MFFFHKDFSSHDRFYTDLPLCARVSALRLRLQSSSTLFILKQVKNVYFDNFDTFITLYYIVLISNTVSLNGRGTKGKLAL